MPRTVGLSRAIAVVACNIALPTRRLTPFGVWFVSVFNHPRWGAGKLKEPAMLQKALFTAVVAATAAASMNASAIGRLANITVIDRSTGQSLPVHYYRGEYWVAGTPWRQVFRSGRQRHRWACPRRDVGGRRQCAERSDCKHRPVRLCFQWPPALRGHRLAQDGATKSLPLSSSRRLRRTPNEPGVRQTSASLAWHCSRRAYQPPVAVTPPPWTVSPRKSAETGAGAAGRAADGVSNSAQSAPPARRRLHRRLRARRRNGQAG